MQTLNVTRDELCRRFWEEIHPRIREGSEIDQVEMLCIASGGVVRGDVKTGVVNEVMKQWKFMADQVDELVKAELYETSFMHYSSPTRFALLYFASIAKHYVVVKRRLLGSNATNPLKGYGDYDVEADIVRTGKMMAEFEDGHLALEKDFFQALEEKRFDEAGALLSAIEISRKNASDLMRAEVNNWRFDLACALGDYKMFFGAWQKIPAAAQVDPVMFHKLLEDLLYNGFIKGIEVLLSDEGRRVAKRASFVQHFCDEQAVLFLRSTIEEIAEALVANKCDTAMGFRNLITESFERSRKSSLAVNPFLKSLSVAWK